jgi:hypothetical protein
MYVFTFGHRYCDCSWSLSTAIINPASWESRAWWRTHLPRDSGETKRKLPECGWLWVQRQRHGHALEPVLVLFVSIISFLSRDLPCSSPATCSRVHQNVISKHFSPCFNVSTFKPADGNSDSATEVQDRRYHRFSLHLPVLMLAHKIGDRRSFVFRLAIRR